MRQLKAVRQTIHPLPLNNLRSKGITDICFVPDGDFVLGEGRSVFFPQKVLIR